jgi:hypothetical protein
MAVAQNPENAVGNRRLKLSPSADLQRLLADKTSRAPAGRNHQGRCAVELRATKNFAPDSLNSFESL